MAGVIRGRLPAKDITPLGKLMSLEAKASNPATDERSLLRIMDESAPTIQDEKSLHGGTSKAFLKQLFSVWRSVIKNPNLTPEGLLKLMRDGWFHESQIEEQRRLPLDFVDNPSFPLYALMGSLPEDLIEEFASAVQVDLWHVPECMPAMRVGVDASGSYGFKQDVTAILAYVGWSDKRTESLPRVDTTLVREFAKFVPASARQRLVDKGYWPGHLVANRRRR